MDLVSVIVFGVNNICRVIIFFWRSIIKLCDYTGEPSQSEVLVKARQRDRETERQTERQRERQRETERQRQTERDRVRETERQRETERDRETQRETERDRETERQTETERDTQIERQRETERQRDTERDRESLIWKGRSPYLLVFQKEKFHCIKKDTTRAHMSLGDICSQCD